jgi:hypothetical protein
VQVDEGRVVARAAAPPRSAAAAGQPSPFASPVPLPQKPRTCSPTRTPAGRPARKPRTSPGAEHPVLDLEALVGLRLDRRQRRVQPLAQDPELQRVEHLVHLLAVPLAEPQVARVDVERARRAPAR